MSVVQFRPWPPTPGSPLRLRVGDRARIEQYQPLDAFTLPGDHLECEVAGIRKQLVGHRAQRRVIARREHAAIMGRTQGIDLVSEQTLGREMRGCKYKRRFGLREPRGVDVVVAEQGLLPAAPSV